MNRGIVEVQKKGQYADLRDDEVDGHLSQGRRLKTWGLLEEVLAGVLEVLEQCCCQENRVWAVE